MPLPNVLHYRRPAGSRIDRHVFENRMGVGSTEAEGAYAGEAWGSAARPRRIVIGDGQPGACKMDVRIQSREVQIAGDPLVFQG
jgi:hypothetical protein